jgi:hypothetical protein
MKTDLATTFEEEFLMGNGYLALFSKLYQSVFDQIPGFKL